VLIEVIIVQFGVTYSWYGKNRMIMDQPSCRNRYGTRRGSASNFNSPRTSRDIKPVTDLEMEETVCGLAAKASSSNGEEPHNLHYSPKIFWVITSKRVRTKTLWSSSYHCFIFRRSKAQV
jgi:hypothetical protein